MVFLETFHPLNLASSEIEFVHSLEDMRHVEQDGVESVIYERGHPSDVDFTPLAEDLRFVSGISGHRFRRSEALTRKLKNVARENKALAPSIDYICADMNENLKDLFPQYKIREIALEATTVGRETVPSQPWHRDKMISAGGADALMVIASYEGAATEYAFENSRGENDQFFSPRSGAVSVHTHKGYHRRPELKSGEKRVILLMTLQKKWLQSKSQ